jgi:hypothetical protein
MLYMAKFDAGKGFGIDTQGEKPARLPPSATWSDNHVTMAKMTLFANGDDPKKSILVQTRDSPQGQVNG